MFFKKRKLNKEINKIVDEIIKELDSDKIADEMIDIIITKVGKSTVIQKPDEIVFKIEK